MVRVRALVRVRVIGSGLGLGLELVLVYTRSLIAPASASQPENATSIDSLHKYQMCPPFATSQGSKHEQVSYV